MYHVFIIIKGRVMQYNFWGYTQSDILSQIMDFPKLFGLEKVEDILHLRFYESHCGFTRIF